MPATQCKNGLTEIESGRQVRKAPGDVWVADTLDLKEGRKSVNRFNNKNKANHIYQVPVRGQLLF